MRATAEQLEGNQVRVSVEVDEAEVDEAVRQTVRRLARQVRVPGFRPGKVPRQVLEARMGGPAALRREAIREAIPDLFARAVQDTELDPVAAPRIDEVSPAQRGPVVFDAMVEVRPRVSVPGYAGLVVTVPPIAVEESEVSEQIDRLREQSGELAAVERPAAAGDWVTIDVQGTSPSGEEIDVADYLYELGSGSAIPGLDECLVGVLPGSEIELAVPPGHLEDLDQSTSGTGADPGEDPSGQSGAAETSGGEEPVARYKVLVKDVQMKVLPEPTDSWAAETSELSTLAELRDDIRDRVRQVKLLSARMALRERALDALSALVAEDPPESMVESELAESLRRLGYELEARRMTVESYVAMTGRSEAELVAEMRAQAERSVRADLALRALADAEAIEVTDSELDEMFAALAERSGTNAAKERERVERGGGLPAVRSERRKAKALEWLIEHVEIVDEEGRPVAAEDLGISAGGAGEEQGSAGGAGEEQASAGGAGEEFDEAVDPEERS